MTKTTEGKGIDYSKDNVFDAIGRPDLKLKLVKPEFNGEIARSEMREEILKIVTSLIGQNYERFSEDDCNTLAEDKTKQIIKSISHFLTVMKIRL